MIRVFIGSEPKQAPAEDVLVHTLRKYHTDEESLEITVMRAGEPPFNDWAGHGPTQFTLFRFAIPEICEFSGAAIYLDCDMMVLDDISLLLDLHLTDGRWNASPVGGPDGDAVSVIDCASVQSLDSWPSIATMKQGGLRKWDLRKLLAPVLVRDIDPAWNSHDRLARGTKLVHFTSLETQPWFMESKPHPDALAVEQWTREFMEL